MGEAQVPGDGDGTVGQSALMVHLMELSSTQRPQDAETGGLVGRGVGSTGAGVWNEYV